MSVFRILCILLALSVVGATPMLAADVTSDATVAVSPDGRLTIGLAVQEGRPHYWVSEMDRPRILPSALGLALRSGAALDADLTIAAVRHRSRDQTWRPVYGERSEIRDHYNEVEVDLVDSQQPPRRLTVRLRAYDQGVALAYHLPSQPGLQTFEITEERTEFRFTGNHRCWPVYSAQGVYEETTVDQIRANCERPLVLQTEDGTYLAVGEARLVDYARMRFQPGDDPHVLRPHLASTVKGQRTLTTPWRFVMVGQSPPELLNNNFLLLNLNDPCAIEDTSWIKPGKVIREVTLTTAGGKACVDFAAANGLQFVEFDAGWYGHEYDDQSDATTITLDPKRSKGPLDLEAIVRYGKKKGIGVIVYVNRRALERQLDELLPLYESWGIAGVKYGFVNVGSQEWTRWLHEAVRKAAEHRLMVDIHDEYRPTGFERTYPNLMTQEGIGGDETAPTNEQTLRNLFTRMIAGAGDHTICYYNDRVPRNANHAYQLAKAVCFYSPWQFLYWYDRPPIPYRPQSTDRAGTIGDEPELEFYREVPAVWDESRALQGEIGRFGVIARRKDNQWFLGAMNGDGARTITVPLDFLDMGQTYEARRYQHDDAVQTRTKVRLTRQSVTAEDSVTIDLDDRSGEAIRFVPAAEQPRN